MKFTASIYKVGINPCIDIPKEVSSALQKKAGYIPVTGTVNGFPFTANLVPVKSGPYRLYVNLPMRQGAKADVGDSVTVMLAYDKTQRVIPMPKELSDALHENPKAKSIWEGLPSSRKKEIKQYINSLKTEAAREKNSKKLIEKWNKVKVLTR